MQEAITELDTVAEEMKEQARIRAEASRPPRRAKAVAVVAPEPKPHRGRPRGKRMVESAPVTALRRAIRDHEREIKRLGRALRAIGG